MAYSDNAEFLGFVRPDRTVGVRNYVAVIPTVFCANDVALKIAEPFDDVVALCHSLGCSHTGMDLKLASRTLKGLGRHPNVGAVLVVGLGRERLTPSDLAEAIAPTGKPVEQILVEQEGELISAVGEGRVIVERLLKRLEEQPRVKCHASALTVAVACEDPDTSTLIAANPSIGAAIDVLVDLGATGIFPANQDLLGAESVLDDRARSPEIASRARAIVGRARRTQAGNSAGRLGTRRQRSSWVRVAGGMTTVTERGLGSLAVSGSHPIVGILDYAEAIPKDRGVFLMDGPVCEAESVTGMVAGGAQIALLSTCHGMPAGFPIAPVIQVVGNPGIFELLRESIDINAGVILQGEAAPQDVGRQILKELLEAASGQLTRAELSHNRELFAVWNGS